MAGRFAPSASQGAANRIRSQDTDLVGFLLSYCPPGPASGIWVANNKLVTVAKIGRSRSPVRTSAPLIPASVPASQAEKSQYLHPRLKLTAFHASPEPLKPVKLLPILLTLLTLPVNTLLSISPLVPAPVAPLEPLLLRGILPCAAASELVSVS